MQLENLVKKAQQGDNKAFADLCKQFEGLMKKTAGKSYVGTVYEDALSTVYLAFIEAVKTYDGNTGIPFAGYAQSKVKFALWNLFKRERRNWQGELSLESETEQEESFLNQLADDTDIEMQIERKLLAAELFGLLGALPAKQRQVILFTVVAGQSLTEAARQLGVTPQAVCGLKKRAIKELKILAEKEDL